MWFHSLLTILIDHLSDLVGDEHPTKFASLPSDLYLIMMEINIGEFEINDLTNTTAGIIEHVHEELIAELGVSPHLVSLRTCKHDQPLLLCQNKYFPSLRLPCLYSTTLYTLYPQPITILKETPNDANIPSNCRGM